MKQVVQAISGGPVRVVDVPRPTIDSTQVLVQTVASVISAGTERAVTALAQSSLLAKARARPDLVRQVINKARTEGIGATARAVRSRLDEDLPLGYSAAGIALEVGEAVAGVAPGQLVATGGAGRANHAEFQAVPGLLCCPVPRGVAAEDAAFATIASVPLHGLRLAEIGPGSKVVVVGLGLLGQMAARLAQATGCDVAGIDVGEFTIERARTSGCFALREAGLETTASILDWSRGRGADAVVVTAATQSSDIVRRVPELCRDRATVVIVGDVGLDLERTPFYERELTLRFARSYGPGRYERSYEDWAVDYPPGFVRWTEGRNIEAVLDLIAAGHLDVGDLVTHRFDIAAAPEAYELIETRREPYLGIALQYPEKPAADEPIVVNPRRAASAAGAGTGVGFIGAGAFASTVLVPAFSAAGFDRLVSVASASGLSARRLAERAGFEKAVSSADAVIDDPDVDVVVIATPHSTHAEYAERALRAGKHVFCEKPLALTIEELDRVEAAWRDSGRVLFVGFNRRWSDSVRLVREHMAGVGPLAISYRVNAGPVPAGHWYNDRVQGGRLIGEVCHFIDTCAAIAGEDVTSVVAVGSGGAERALATDLSVSLGFANGTASIVYASGGPAGLAKERVEVLGRGKHAIIDDFRRVELDGKVTSFGGQDKGHRRQVEAFTEAIASDGSSAAAIASARATLRAASRLDNGM
ncbi:MAG TPA: bi-domain-containing oxidoreductase [Acidimicrobiales bacterium]